MGEGTNLQTLHGRPRAAGFDRLSNVHLISVPVVVRPDTNKVDQREELLNSVLPGVLVSILPVSSVTICSYIGVPVRHHRFFESRAQQALVVCANRFLMV
jgi:hypothetical protein